MTDMAVMGDLAVLPVVWGSITTGVALDLPAPIYHRLGTLAGACQLKLFVELGEGCNFPFPKNESEPYDDCTT